jgi:hypothetical protein
VQRVMETDVEGLIGAGRHERSGERTAYRKVWLEGKAAICPRKSRAHRNNRPFGGHKTLTGVVEETEGNMSSILSSTDPNRPLSLEYKSLDYGISETLTGLSS